MRTVTYKLEDLKTKVIHIGKVAENDATRVQIDAGSVFAEHPAAVPTMSMINPDGTAFPVSVERSGDLVLWDVKDSALAAEGQGEIQFTFTEGNTVVKGPVGRVQICRSIVGDGEAPDPIQDWMTEADAALEEIENISATAETLSAGSQATASYDSGVLTFGIPQGAQGAPGQDGQDGADGQDGVSPTVAVTTTTGGHTVTITDAQGDHAFNVMDGTAGAVIDDTSTAADKVWSASKTNELKSTIQQKYTLPSDGIPSSDMASAVQTSLGKADTAYQKPSGGIPLSDLASNVTTVSGSTPSITGVAGFRYICGEVSTLTIVVPASGCIDVTFESGSTATVLTITPPTGKTVMWANSFDPTSLEANTTYELNIMDCKGVAGSWT